MARQIVKIGDLSSSDFSTTSNKLSIKNKVVINDETSNVAPSLGASPTNVPSVVSRDLVLEEVYSDLIRYWYYDISTSSWVHKGDFKSLSIISDTKANLIVKRDNSQLIPGKLYIVSDYSNTNLGLIKLYLEAIESNKFKEECTIISSLFNESIVGNFDLDNGRLDYVMDSNSNQVYGETAINNFKFGDANVRNNLIKYSTCNISNGVSFFENIIEGGSIVTVNGGTLKNTTIKNNCTVTINSGIHFNNYIYNSSIVNQVGTGVVKRSLIDKESNITIGNVTLNQDSFSYYLIDTTGSTGNIEKTSFSNGTSPSLTNCPDLYIYECTINSSASLVCDLSVYFHIVNTQMTSYSKVTAAANSSVLVQSCSLSSTSNIISNSGKISIYDSSINTYSTITHNSSAIDNTLNKCELNTQCTITIDDTSSNTQLDSVLMSSGSSIHVYNASTGTKIIKSSLSSNGHINIDGSTSARVEMSNIESNGGVIITNCTAKFYVYLCSVYSSGQLKGTGNTTVVNCFHYSVFSSGTLDVRSCINAPANIYYGTVFAYSTLNITLDAYTSQRLVSYGGSYITITNPNNGTGIINF